MNNKILVIAAHPDDEVLGCAGSIAKHIANKDEVILLIMSQGESSRAKTDQNKSQRLLSIKSVAKILKISSYFIEDLPDNKLDTIPMLSIVKKIEGYLKKIKPSIVYTHFYNDLNIDHQIVSKATLTACRPQPGSSVKEILLFEVMSSTDWNVKDPLFTPNVYIDITNFWDLKLRALKVYEKEMRKYPHSRSYEHLSALAKYRGGSVGYNYAEAFQLVRLLK